MNTYPAKRALVFAFKKEALSFIERLKQVQKIKLTHSTVYCGEYLGQPTTVVITGCGERSAYEATKEALGFFAELTSIYNIGFVGAISDIYDINDVLQVGQVFTSGGELIQQKIMLHNTLPIVKCITSSKPVETNEEKLKISNQCDVDIVDMEAVGFCNALINFTGSVSLIKIISDLADSDFKSEVIKNSGLLSKKLRVSFERALEAKILN